MEITFRCEEKSLEKSLDNLKVEKVWTQCNDLIRSHVPCVVSQYVRHYIDWEQNQTSTFDIRCSILSARGASPPHGACEAGGDALPAQIFDIHWNNLFFQKQPANIEYPISNNECRSSVLCSINILTRTLRFNPHGSGWNESVALRPYFLYF